MLNWLLGKNSTKGSSTPSSVEAEPQPQPVENTGTIPEEPDSNGEEEDAPSSNKTREPDDATIDAVRTGVDDIAMMDDDDVSDRDSTSRLKPNAEDGGSSIEANGRHQNTLAPQEISVSGE